MKTEKDTYETLKHKIPYDEMRELYEDHKPTIPPVYAIGTQSFERTLYYPMSTWVYEKNKILEENGWTLEEYAKESERRAMIFAIQKVNEEFSKLIPSDIIEHAKNFFPNIKVTYPKIELE